MALARFVTAALALVLLSVPGATSSGAPARFLGLGVLSEAAPVPSGAANDVSDDGCVVVGRGRGELTTRAVRWEAGTPAELPGRPDRSVATAVSGDGAVSVGADDGEAVRWEGGAFETLGDLRSTPGVRGESAAHDVSSDGSVIVGWARRDVTTPPPFPFPRLGEFVAFRWEDGVMEDLGRLPGATGTSMALAVSADASVVVGWSDSAEGTRAFRWQAGEMTDLGTLPGGGSFGSQAFGVSPDGSVVVGRSWTADTLLGFRWEGGVMRALAAPPGRSYRSVLAVDASRDGSLVVGCGIGAGGVGVGCDDALVWDEAGEARHVEALLREFGLGPHIEGWTLQRAAAIAPDARTLVGSGLSPAGREEAWIASAPTGFDRPAPPGAGKASFRGGATPPGLRAPPRCGAPWPR